MTEATHTGVEGPRLVVTQASWWWGPPWWRWGWVLEAGACVVAAGASLGLFLYRAGSFSLWYDETFSLAEATVPWGVFWKTHETNMVVYYVLLRMWLGLTAAFGIAPSALVARLPSVVAMSLACVVVLLIGSRYWSLAAGLVASLLFAVDGLVLQLAQLTRGYAFETLFSCVAWCAVLLILEQPKAKRWWILYGAATILAIGCDLIAIFDVGAQIAGVGILFVPRVARRADGFAFYRDRSWRAALWPGLGAFAVIGVACLYLVYDSLGKHGSPSFVPLATPSGLWDFVRTQTEFQSLAALGLICAVAAGVFLGLRKRRGVFVLLLAWAMLPVALPYLLTQPYLDLHFFYPRYLSDAIPAILLLAAIGVTELRPKPAAVLGSAVLFSLLAQTVGGYYSYAERQPFAEVAAWMERRFSSGDGVICRPATKACGTPVGYYLQHLYLGPQSMPATFPGDYIYARYRSFPTTNSALRPYLGRRRRVFVFTVAPIGGDPATVVDNVPRFLIRSGYRVVGSYRPAPCCARGDVEVQEYLRQP